MRVGVVYGLYCVCPECPGDEIRYIGQTTQKPQRRLQAHITASYSPNTKDFDTFKGAWVRAHGRDNIRLRVLYSGSDLCTREKDLIRDFNTLTPAGLNMTIGGYDGAGQKGESNPGAKLSVDDVRRMIERISSPGATSRSVAEEFGVTKTLVLKVDHGDLWPDLDRPNGTHVLAQNRKRVIDKTLAHEIRSRFNSGGVTKADLAREYGVSFGVIRNAVKEGTWK